MPADPRSGNLILALTVVADLALPGVVTEASLHSLSAFALMEEGATDDWEIHLLFTGDAVIQEVHRDFMRLDSPTDIMTFPYDTGDFSPANAIPHGGDIVISVETAAINATDANWSLGEELEFLVLHGILHILGWDDAVDDQRSRMLDRQAEILSRWRIRAT